MKIRNCSIDIFRYIAALLVVAIHTTVFVEYSPLVSYMVAQVLPRIAVPFFFAVSGYFYMAKLENGTADFWRYIKRLLLPYTLWSIVYYLEDLIENGTLHLADVLQTYLLFGSEMHFWFFPALIFWVTIVTFVYRMGLKKILIPTSLTFYSVGCLFHAYYRIGIQIPGMLAFTQLDRWLWITHVLFLGFPYFICGYLLLKTEKIWNKVSNRKISCILGTAFLLYIGEVVVLKALDIASTITITGTLYIFVYFLLLFLLRHPMPKWQAVSKCCNVLSNYTYYSHALFITILTALSHNSLAETPMFFVVSGITLVTGLLLVKSKNKYLRMLAA